MDTNFYDSVLAMRQRMAALGHQLPAKLELARLLKYNETADAIVDAQPACRSDVYFDTHPAYIAQ